MRETRSPSGDIPQMDHPPLPLRGCWSSHTRAADECRAEVNGSDVARQRSPAPTSLTCGSLLLRRWVWRGLLAYVLSVALLALTGVVRLTLAVGSLVAHLLGVASGHERGVAALMTMRLRQIPAGCDGCERSAPRIGAPNTIGSSTKTQRSACCVRCTRCEPVGSVGRRRATTV